uniref:Adenylate cyclase n=1 Tax=Solibacter usitatus (strain Ellin6076) TaxID=234267 RepID=Q029T7_SOLUE
MKKEVEVKLAVRDARSARRRLLDAGFKVLARRTFETNLVFDTAGMTLRRSSRLIRLRQAGKAITLTYKGEPLPGKHKSREELEVEVADLDAMSAILSRLGYLQSFRYDKYRTEFHQPGHSGHVMLDETPVGVFIELEGSPSWIDRTARTLGFHEDAYITASYGRLYLEWCAAHGLKPADMVF